MGHEYLIDKFNKVAFHMSPDDVNPENFIVNLYDIGAIQFGSFELKSGITSPIYLDLRKTFTFPHVLRQVAELLWLQVQPLYYDLICGVPLTALVFASSLAMKQQLPMIVCRKERKSYGKQNRIEGEFFPDQHCVVIEDLITSGASLLETIEPLKEESLVVTDIVCLLDRQQGGRERLEERGYRVHPVFQLTDMLDVLQEHKKITEEENNKVKEFIKQNQVAPC